jgi:thiamine pyrophosphate-dependent acetolactate synthase large subunit-like protein
LFNPDFHDLAKSFGMQSVRITRKDEINGAIQAALTQRSPILIEVNTSLDAILP